MLNRGVRLAISALLLCVTIPAARAQEDLDKGKTAAQLFASDCGICHKSPRSVARTDDVFGLENFLREHYTASRESAAAIATYLKGFQKSSTAAVRGRTARHTSQVGPSEHTLKKSHVGEPRPPADIPRPPADIKSQKPN